MATLSIARALVAGQQCLDNCVKAATKNQPKICSEQSAKKAAKACVVGYRTAIQDSCSQTCDAGGLVNLVPNPDGACSPYRNILPKPSVHKGCSQGYRNGFEEVMRVVNHVGVQAFEQNGDSLDEPRVNVATQRERQDPGQYARTERRRRMVEVNQAPKDHPKPQRPQDRLEARHARAEQVQHSRIPQRRATQKTEDHIKTEIKEVQKEVEVKENVLEKAQETKKDDMPQRSTKLAEEGKVEVNKMVLDEIPQENQVEAKAGKVEVNKMILETKEEAKAEEIVQVPVEETKVEPTAEEAKIEVAEVVVDKKLEEPQVEVNKASEKLVEEQKIERNKVVMDEKSEEARKKNEEANLLETLQRSIKMADQRDVGKKQVPRRAANVAEGIKENKAQEHVPINIVEEMKNVKDEHKEAKKASTLKGSKVQEVAGQVLRSIEEILHHHKEEAHAVPQDASAPAQADTPVAPMGAV